MKNIQFGIDFFGGRNNKSSFDKTLEILKENITRFKIYLIIAGTETSQIIQGFFHGLFINYLFTYNLGSI